MTSPFRTARRVAIVAMGASHADYVLHSAAAGGRHALFDEVWAINAMGGTIDCDLVFAMDQPAYLKAKGETEGEMAGYAAWLRKIRVPVLTTKPDREICPMSEEYPLEAVLGKLPYAYFDNTVAYAVAYAIASGTVEQLSLYGCDFTYPDQHVSERGRACVEFLLGQAVARGMLIGTARSSTLLNASGGPRFYGYNGGVTVEPDGRVTLDRDKIGMEPWGAAAHAGTAPAAAGTAPAARRARRVSRGRGAPVPASAAPAPAGEA